MPDRDLSGVILVFAVIFALGAMMSFATDAGTVNPNALQTISGTVEHAPFMSYGMKGGSNIHVFVRGNDRVYDLTQEDMSGFVPGIMDGIMALRVGDKVTARVKHDALGRNLDWVWEIQCNGVTLLSDQEIHLFSERRNARLRLMGHWASGLSLAMFSLAIFLRKRSAIARGQAN